MKPVFFLASLIILFLLSCEAPSHTARLAILGDLMIGRSIVPNKETLRYLSPTIREADLAIANLEGSLSYGGNQKKADWGYNLCAQPARASFLPKWGLDLVSLANNHRFDGGPVEGHIFKHDDATWQNTAKVVRSVGLTPIGPSFEPVYRVLNGLKLAFFAQDDIIGAVDEAGAEKAIKKASEAGYIVIIYIHWGIEYSSIQSPRQERIAKKFSDAGASLIIGSHPHVVQPIQWLRGKHKTLVFYSLGNALFDQEDPIETTQSAMACVVLDESGVRSYGLIPFAIDKRHSLIVAPEPSSEKKVIADLQIH